MPAWFWVFFPAAVASTVVAITTFWQIVNAKNLTLFGFHFSGLWTFWAVYCLFTAVLFYPVNYLFTYAYWYGYNVAFPGKAWRTQETIWLASIFVMFLTAWLYLGELPTKNAFVVLFFLLCALLALLWK